MIMLAISAALMTIASPSASAQTFPEAMGYSGTLTKDGQPFTGTVSVTFALRDAAVGGDEIWSESQSVTVANGEIRAELGEMEALDGVFDGAPLWLELTVDGATLAPRTYVGTQPYAWRAKVAGDAATLGGNSVQDILGQVPAPTSATVPFDDAGAGLGQTTSQGAIEELARRLAALEQTVTTQQTELAQTQMDLTASEGRVSTLTQDLGQALGRISTLETDLGAARADTMTNTSQITANTGAIASQSSAVTSNKADITALQMLTQDMTRATINGAASVVFESVNLHVRSGSGATNGFPSNAASTSPGQTSTNGLGNLIIGYDESTIPPTTTKTGSHNLIIGGRHSYSSFRGVFAGWENTTAGPYATVPGVALDTASRNVA